MLGQYTAGPSSARTAFKYILKIDLIDFYRQWLLVLHEYGARYEIVDFTTGDFLRISNLEKIDSVLAGDRKTTYSDKEIRYVIENNHFCYQAIKLPNGQLTAGQDRSQSRDIIFYTYIKDVKGKSLLDVGCSYGYFSFEAEKRGAARVLAIEADESAYLGCNILKEIFGSKIEIMHKDIFCESFEEKFDIILLLNVLHDLKEPMRALRKLADLCNQTLIIEFRTITDIKFQSTLGNQEIPIDNTLPLIGVGNTTNWSFFYFSEEALRRLLVTRDKLFSSVEFAQSPMSPYRKIAVCRK